VFKEQFYWDSYFTLVGLRVAEKHELAQGMVDNLLDLFRRFDYIPNSNNRLHSGRSQPPLLSSMIVDCFVYNQDERWLEQALQSLEREYHHVWLDANRQVHHKLSRYYHQDKTHRGAEDESGWDYTIRFAGRALDFLPVDLNALLYKYETDIAHLNEQLGHAATEWHRSADQRKDHYNQLFWDETRGLFFDFDYVAQRQGNIASLASYLPLFCGMASPEQAYRLVENLPIFETEHGLATTELLNEIYDGKQWTCPNGWAPLHFIVVEGLRRYGYHDDAYRIARKWVATVDQLFDRVGMLYEKYNIIDPLMPPVSAVYPDQVGFAWTNAITLYFIENHL
jgi:alpha,alpha-trehalase